MNTVIVAVTVTTEAAEKWSKDVETSWSPPEGLFTESAKKIAETLKRESKDLKQASSRLSFYRNRAGKNLSPERKHTLELAQEKLRNLYE